MPWLSETSAPVWSLDPFDSKYWPSERLEGVRNGRVWSIRLGGRERPEEILVRGDFRGAPPGEEKHRFLPYFYVGPPRAFLTSSNTGRANQLFAMARRDLRSPWSGERLPPVTRPIMIFATYSPASRALHQPEWLSRYAKWDGITKCERGLRAPSLVGLVPDLEFRMGIPAANLVGICSTVVKETLDLADPLEALFDAPSSIAVPIETELVTVSDQQPDKRRSLTYVCPKCSRLEGARPHNSKFGWLDNVQTVHCHERIYADHVPP